MKISFRSYFQRAFTKLPKLPPSQTSPFTEDAVKLYVLSHRSLKTLITEAICPEEWTAEEVGDGNINFVYIVSGPSKTIIVKQGLDYLRLIGKTCKLTQDRTRIEALWLEQQHEVCPEHVPQIYLYDPQLSVIVMEYLPPPFVSLRTGILQGQIYPQMSHHVAQYLSKTLFAGSKFALSQEEHKKKMDLFHNPELCDFSARIIFVDPYHDEPLNNYPKPDLNEAVSTIWNDLSMRLCACRLRDLFLSKRETIIHGDFHTGSVMACENGLYVIDGEFAFAGPMAFDVGKFIGNLFLTFFALDGHSTTDHPRNQQQQWLLDSIFKIWNEFKESFLKFWDNNSTIGVVLPVQLVDSPSSKLFKTFQEDFMKSLLRETLAFGGACMIRRIISLAQIQDYTTIPDRNTRVLCSKRALKLARVMLLQIQHHNEPLEIQAVIELSRKIRAEA